MTEVTVAVSRRRLTLATATQIGARVVGAALGVVVAATLARTLSRPAFGQLSLALTILALVGSLGDLGMNQIAVREMAREPAQRARIAGALATAQLITGVILALVGIVVAYALLSGHQARIMAIFVMAGMPLSAVSGLTVAFQARLRPELVMLPSLVQNVVWLAVVVVLGEIGTGLALYGVGAFAAVVSQSLVTLAIAARVTDVHLAETRRLIIELLKLAWPIGLAGVFVTAYYRIDGVLLFHYRGATATAYYSAAYRVLDVLQIVPATVGGVLLPFLAGAQEGPQGAARAHRAFELAVIVLLSFAVPAAVLGGILAPGAVDAVYGGAYHRAALLLQILLPAFIPICLGYVLTGQLILHGMLRPYIVITFAGALINVLANAIAIPVWGAPVAAWSTVGTEFLVMGAIATVVQRRLGLRLPAIRILRCLGATVIAAVCVWLVRSAPLAVGLAVGAIVYPPLLLASRAISAAELRALLTRDPVANA